MRRETVWSVLGRSFSLSVFLDTPPPQDGRAMRNRRSEAEARQRECRRELPERGTADRR